MHATRYLVGIIAIALAASAMGAAVYAQHLAEQAHRQAEKVPSTTQKTLRVGGVSVSWGRKDEQRIREEQEKAAQMSATAANVRLGAAAAAIVAIVVGILSYVRERRMVLAGAAVALAAAGLLWQYIIVGVVVAVAIFVLALLFSNF